MSAPANFLLIVLGIAVLIGLVAVCRFLTRHASCPQCGSDLRVIEVAGSGSSHAKSWVCHHCGYIEKTVPIRTKWSGLSPEGVYQYPASLFGQFFVMVLEKFVTYCASRGIMWPVVSILALGALVALDLGALGSLRILQGSGFPYPSDMMIEAWKICPWVVAAFIVAGIILQRFQRHLLAVICYLTATAGSAYLCLAALKTIGDAFNSAPL